MNFKYLNRVLVAQIKVEMEWCSWAYLHEVHENGGVAGYILELRDYGDADCHMPYEFRTKKDVFKWLDRTEEVLSYEIVEEYEEGIDIDVL